MPSRVGRGRWAAADFVVCFGWGGFFFRVFSRSLHSQIRTSRAVSVDSVKGLRQPANLPTENSRPPIPTRCTVLCAPTSEILRAWRHQLISIAGQHGSSLSDPPRPFQHNFSKLRERHSPMLARQNTTADVRKRGIEACALTSSIVAGRCVGVLRVAQSRCPTFLLSCESSSQVHIGSFHKI